MKFLVIFVHRHLDFRLAELNALLKLQSLDPLDSYDQGLWDVYAEEIKNEEPNISPVIVVDLPSFSHAKYLSKRGILIKAVYEIWGEGSSYEKLRESIKKNNIDAKAACSPARSWKLDVVAFGRSFTMDEQRERRLELKAVLPVQGRVEMKNPDEVFVVFEDIGITRERQENLNPERIFLLRTVAGGFKNKRRGGARDLVDQQTLKRRQYIGPTSMDSELALLMANMALVRDHDLVLDPFVGTGSVLISCSNFGAKCFGIDIDIRVLKGKENRDVFSNFEQYGLPLPELLRADNSLSPVCAGNFFDAIVCDPPVSARV